MPRQEGCESDSADILHRRFSHTTPDLRPASSNNPYSSKLTGTKLVRSENYIHSISDDESETSREAELLCTRVSRKILHELEPALTPQYKPQSFRDGTSSAYGPRSRGDGYSRESYTRSAAERENARTDATENRYLAGSYPLSETRSAQTSDTCKGNQQNNTAAISIQLNGTEIEPSFKQAALEPAEKYKVEHEEIGSCPVEPPVDIFRRSSIEELREEIFREGGPLKMNDAKTDPTLTQNNLDRNEPEQSERSQPRDTNGPSSSSPCSNDVINRAFFLEAHHDYKLIDNVVYNLRDISMSSCHATIKPNLLFRSARPFTTNYEDLQEVLVHKLKIRTVIDLRDENLTAIPEEMSSRLMLANFFHQFQATSARDRLLVESTLRDKAQVSRDSLRRMWRTPHGRTPSAPASPNLRPTVPSSNASSPDRKESQLIKSRPELPQQIIHAITQNPACAVLADIFGNQHRRRLVVVNVLDSPEVKKRILETVSGSPYLPLVVLAKAADKLTGTALAPFYFCKYIMSAHDIAESYYEMLDNCGANFGLALKIIALSTGPVLFHCSLGKDRTGVLAMLLLTILGASESAIIFDYCLTQQACDGYQQYNRKFITTYSGLPETFCSSNAETMRRCMNYVKAKWGSVIDYLDSIGVTLLWRHFIRHKYLKNTF